jgi:hypothetical protein
VFFAYIDCLHRWRDNNVTVSAYGAPDRQPILHATDTDWLPLPHLKR